MKTNPFCPDCGKKGYTKIMFTGVFNVHFCSRCGNAFTAPQPKNIGEYYSKNYWKSPGFIGSVRAAAYQLFQTRRASWITKIVPKGNILDVGAGEAEFAKSLPKRFRTISIEPTASKVVNPDVLKNDFLTWHSDQKFDCICFWESLEHTPCPQKYLQKAYQLLNQNGKIFIEYPRLNVFESRLFGAKWFHLDTPRHLVHMTNDGMVYLLKKAGFKNIQLKGVLSFEYSPWGLAASIFNTLNFDITSKTNKTGDFLIAILLAPFLALCAIIEIGFWIFGESPISLATAEKT